MENIFNPFNPFFTGLYSLFSPQKYTTTHLQKKVYRIQIFYIYILLAGHQRVQDSACVPCHPGTGNVFLLTCHDDTAKSLCNPEPGHQRTAMRPCAGLSVTQSRCSAVVNNNDLCGPPQSGTWQWVAPGSMCRVKGGHWACVIETSTSTEGTDHLVPAMEGLFHHTGQPGITPYRAHAHKCC